MTHRALGSHQGQKSNCWILQKKHVLLHPKVQKKKKVEGRKLSEKSMCLFHSIGYIIHGYTILPACVSLTHITIFTGQNVNIGFIGYQTGQLYHFLTKMWQGGHIKASKRDLPSVIWKRQTFQELVESENYEGLSRLCQNAGQPKLYKGLGRCIETVVATVAVVGAEYKQFIVWITK